MLKRFETIMTDTKGKAEEAWLTTRDKMKDQVETLTGAAEKSYLAAKGTLEAFAVSGIVVAAIVAPVPTLAGLAILFIMESSVESAVKGVDQKIRDAKHQRDRDRALALLKKHGKVPAVAHVSTDYLTMELHAETGQADGVVIKGAFRTRKLSSLSGDELQFLRDHAPDHHTAELIDAYVSFQQTKANAVNTPG